MSEARAIYPPPIAGALLAEERLHVGPLLRDSGVVNGKREVLARLLGHAEPHVELTQRAAGGESLGLERYCPLQMLEGALDLVLPRARDAEHGVRRGRVRPQRDGLLEERDGLLQPASLEGVLPGLEGLAAVPDGSCGAARHKGTLLTAGRRGYGPA